jgi:hypothetical protein
MRTQGEAPMNKERKIPVEVYSRVVGYFRPVNQWNKGKREEFSERKEFTLKGLNEAFIYEYKGRPEDVSDRLSR